MASSPITSWKIDGVMMETMTDFIFSGSKIITDGDYNYEIKTLAPWKKSYDKPRQCSAWASNREQEAGSPDFYQFSSVQSLSRV